MRIIYFISFLFLVINSGCSVHQSDGSKALEKNTGNVVVAGFHLNLAVKYECQKMMALPLSWQEQVTDLNEFVSEPPIQARLDNKKELPTVLVYSTHERSFEGCVLEVLDSKFSSQKLNEVVSFGEELLLRR